MKSKINGRVLYDRQIDRQADKIQRDRKTDRIRQPESIEALYCRLLCHFNNNNWQKRSQSYASPRSAGEELHQQSKHRQQYKRLSIRQQTKTNHLPDTLKCFQVVFGLVVRLRQVLCLLSYCRQTENKNRDCSTKFTLRVQIKRGKLQDFSLASISRCSISFLR